MADNKTQQQSLERHYIKNGYLDRSFHLLLPEATISSDTEVTASFHPVDGKKELQRKNQKHQELLYRERIAIPGCLMQTGAMTS